MQDIFFVGLGGFVGAIARFVVGSIIQSRSGLLGFPIGTLGVNTLGCLVIGFLSQIAVTHNLFTSEIRLLVFTGFLGAFTTFSTFGNETIGLVQKGQPGMAISYVSLHLLCGFGAVVLGYAIGKLV